MEARIDVITPGVADLERALALYRAGLGLESDGVIGTEYVAGDVTPAGAIALFKLPGGLILSPYPRIDLAKDADVRLGTPKHGHLWETIWTPRMIPRLDTRLSATQR